MDRMDQDTKNRITLRSRAVRYTLDALAALSDMNMDITDVPLEVHFRTIPSSEFFVIKNEEKIFFTRDNPLISLGECLEYLKKYK